MVPCHGLHKIEAKTTMARPGRRCFEQGDTMLKLSRSHLFHYSLQCISIQFHLIQPQSHPRPSPSLLASNFSFQTPLLFLHSFFCISPLMFTRVEIPPAQCATPSRTIQTKDAILPKYLTPRPPTQVTARPDQRISALHQSVLAKHFFSSQYSIAVPLE